MVPVAGTGVVVGWTLNEQQWSPDFHRPTSWPSSPSTRSAGSTDDAPVNVAADDVSVGDRVEVRFEHVEDVWLPVFVPGAVPLTPATPGR